MSSILYGAIVAKREAAQPGEEPAQPAPGASTYVDSLAALVPAEVLALHAVIVGFCTKKGEGSKADSEITEPTTLKWAFWALVVLASLLFFAGRGRSKTSGLKSPGIVVTLVQGLIPAAAFVAWTMLLKASAFDAIDVELASGARDTIAVIATVVLGAIAAQLGYKLNQTAPKAVAPPAAAGEKRRFATATISVLVIGAVLALAGAANAAGPLVLRTNAGPLTVNAPIEAVATSVYAEGGQYRVTCASNVLGGQISAKSAGSATIPFADSGLAGCLISGGIYGSGQPVTVTAAELPWTMRLSAHGTATLKGSTGIEYTVQPEGFPVTCTYTAKRYKGVIEVDEGTSQALVAFARQPIAGLKTNNAACPAIASISAWYRLYSNGESVEAQL